MKKKKLSPLWLIPAVVIVALILWCIRFPLTMFMGLDKDAEIASAGIGIYHADAKSEIPFSTNDSQQLAEIVEQLQKVRCRFFGWSNRMYYDEEDKPQLVLHITGYEGDTPFNMGIWVNGKKDVIVTNGDVLLRAKDSGLYDYLTVLAANGKDPAFVREGTVAKEVAANYVEKLSRVIYLYEDIDLAESTVLAYGDAPEMQYVVEKSEELKARRVAEGHFRTDWGSMYGADVVEISEDSATVSVEESISFRYKDVDFDSAMGNEYTVTLKKLNGEWLVSSVEGGDTYSLKEMETYQYRKAMPELYAQAGVGAFSFDDTLSVQVTNVIRKETHVLPAEDNFEYEVYTVLPGAEIEVLHAAVEDTVELGPLGIWKVYSKDGTLQYLESGMPNIPITENINGIGTESVCILVFELYTGEA